MATHSSVLAWRIPGSGELGWLPSMGSHRVGHNWSDLAAAAASPWWPQEKNCSLNTIKGYQDLETSIQESSWGLGPWLSPLPALGLEPMNVSELPSVHLSNRDSKYLPHLFVLKIKADHACQAQDWHISLTINNIWAFFFFFFFRIFCADHFLKSLLSLLQYCFCFMFWFWAMRYMGF